MVTWNRNKSTEKNIVSNAITTTTKNSYILLIDDTYGFDDVRIYDEICPTLRSKRSGQKIIMRN